MTLTTSPRLTGKFKCSQNPRRSPSRFQDPTPNISFGMLTDLKVDRGQGPVEQIIVLLRFVPNS